MIDLNNNGIISKIVTEDDMYSLMNNEFQYLFSNYLSTVHKITTEEFNEMIKDKYPEKFV